MTTTLAPVTELSDHELLARVHAAARAERRATAQLIVLLMELDARRLYLGEGFSSLFAYCTQALHLSESRAYNRIEVARAARRFPGILDLLADGALTLTTVRLLAPHLTPANHRDVLARARHKSKRDVERLVAALHPQPDLPPAIRKLPAPPSLTAPSPAAPPMSVSVSAPTSIVGDEGETAAPPPPLDFPRLRRAEVRPLAPERYKVQFTMSRGTHDKLRRAQDLLRHVVPDGDPAVIFDRALTLLVAELERRKTAATDRPRPAQAAKTRSRHIPAAVKRAVWQRDGGRCAFAGKQGRCPETGFLEYHHVVPFAAGGEASADNVELRYHRARRTAVHPLSGEIAR